MSGMANGASVLHWGVIYVGDWVSWEMEFGVQEILKK